MDRIKRFSKYLVPLTLAFLPVLVFAQLQPPIPTGTGITLPEIEKRISQVANSLIVVGVIIAVIFIIWGGVLYMAAGGDPKKVETAQTRIKSGLIGAIIVLGVGVILNTLAKVVTRTFFG